MPKKYELLSLPSIKIGGSNASKTVYDNIVSIEVDDTLLMPSAFVIRLNDPDLKLISSDTTFELGKEVELGMQGGDQSQSTRLITGDITAIEPEFGEGGSTTLSIRGYDKSFRLHRGKKTRTFTKVTDSDMAKKIASGCSLSLTSDSTSQVYEYICQDNQSDMEFLRERAGRNGFFVYVDNKNLCFVSKPKGTNTVTLERGSDLINFQARLTAVEQVDSVKVRGWDPVKKQEIIGEAKNPDDAPSFGITKSGGKTATGAFGSASTTETINRTVETPKAAQVLAQSLYNEISNAFIQAEGSCLGNPELHAGTTVEVKALGARFSGKYRVTRAIHRYDESGKYTTWFEISGRRSNTVGEILTSKNHDGNGVVVGLVTNTNDPEDLARVKVKFPTLAVDGQQMVESCWARLVSPMAGSNRGIEFIPEVDDEVLVAFENGDINRPYILGSLWNKTDKPPEATSGAINKNDGKVNKRIIRSRSGHTITLDDTDGKEKISIIDKTKKNSIEIDSSNNLLSGKADKKIEIQTTGGRKILIDDQGKIEIIDGQSSIKMDANSGIEIQGGMKLTLKAQTIELEGTQLNLKGQAAVNLESAMTTVKGSGVLTLQGGLVKIN
jgi:phage protein D/phage baseplate assembly protein gpV